MSEVKTKVSGNERSHNEFGSTISNSFTDPGDHAIAYCKLAFPSRYIKL